jgi:hypothetical protein
MTCRVWKYTGYLAAKVHATFTMAKRGPLVDSPNTQEPPPPLPPCVANEALLQGLGDFSETEPLS